MLSIKLFPKTFKKFQSLIFRNQFIQQHILNKTKNPYTQMHIGNLYSMTNLISTSLSEIQADYITKFLEEFLIKDGVNFKQQQKINKNNIKIKDDVIKENQDFYYDQDKNYFVIKSKYYFREKLPQIQSFQQLKQLKPIVKEDNILKIPYSQPFNLTIKVYNCKNQKMDHPAIRKTLYFHQLKDIDKYVKYQVLPKTPLFIQDMNRKKLQMGVLDKKNPYGLPKNAPPLLFDVQLQNKVYFRIKSTYEETNIIQIGRVQSQKYMKISSQKPLKRYPHLSAMKVPRSVQNIIYKDLLNNLLEIDDNKILQYHKLAYLGGRIQKLNLMMNIHQLLSLQNEQFHKQFFPV